MTSLIERDHESGIEIIGHPETTRRDLIAEVRGEPQNVVRVLELHDGQGAGGWSDITQDIAQEIYAQCCEDLERPDWHLLNFLQRHDAAPLSLVAAE